METSNIFNLDLLSVGLAIASIGILGFIVFFNNRRSITNKTFLFLSLAIIFWSLVNYIGYQILIPGIALWVLRSVMFFAVWFAFFVMQLLFVFPREKVQFTVLYKFVLVILVMFTSVLTLTPLVFQKVAEVSITGQITKIINGPGIFLFGAVVIGLNLWGIFLLIRKVLTASGIERKQYRTVLVGILTTLFLIIIFNFILPAFFDNPRFIPLGAVFIFPFVAFTAYAIFKHHLLNVKIITTELLTFILAVVTFFEIVLSQDIVVLIFRSGVFILVLAFGILLIRSVRREIEQREKLEELTKELQTANERLTELDRLKTEFLSFASHQVKAPLAIMKGFATLILEGDYGPISEKIHEVIFKIKSSCDQMIALVNNILDLRRLEEGKMQYDFKDVVLGNFVAQIVNELKPLADQKKLELNFIDSVKDARAKIDEQKFHQVIQNFIDNAIKYTPAGWIKVELNSDGREIRIAISDSGMGISPELLPKLFQQFSRDPQSRKLIQGTGLGLYIAKQIVEAHGGSVEASSAGPGTGSTFLIRLPKI